MYEDDIITLKIDDDSKRGKLTQAMIAAGHIGSHARDVSEAIPEADRKGRLLLDKLMCALSDLEAHLGQVAEDGGL